MSYPLSRRRFLQASAACGVAAVAGAEGMGQRPPAPGKLVLNDDGHVFLHSNDDLGKAELRRYLQSYCRPGLDTVAYCVGDMSWPTLYPTHVGVYYSALGAGGDLGRSRMYKNVENLASEPGGYFGAAFAILRELGKKALASFRMNDAHFTSIDNPHASPFWKQHAKLALGPAYGYYGGCLSNDANYRHYDPDLASMDRRSGQAGSLPHGGQRRLKAALRCYEDYDRTQAIALRFKIENVARTEQFQASLNGHRIEPGRGQVRYAANGRDTRIHTVKLGPYLEYEVALRPDQLRRGENVLEVTPKRLTADLATKINLVEIELHVRYGRKS